MPRSFFIYRVTGHLAGGPPEGSSHATNGGQDECSKENKPVDNVSLHFHVFFKHSNVSLR